MNVPHFQFLLFGVKFILAARSVFGTARYKKKKECGERKPIRASERRDSLFVLPFVCCYLHNLDECFQLVGVELQVQSVRQPNTHRLHGARVPLLHKHNADILKSVLCQSSSDHRYSRRRPRLSADVSAVGLNSLINL